MGRGHYHLRVVIHHFRRLLSIWVRQTRYVVAACSGALLVLLMSVAIPQTLRLAIDRAITPGRTDLLAPFVGLFLAAAALKALGIYTRKRYAGKASVATEMRVREQLYDHLHALDMAYHSKMPAGQLMSRASSDLQHAGNTLGVMPFFTASFGLLITVSVILFVIDPLLASVVLAGLPAMAFLAVKFTSKLDPIVYATQQHLGEMTSVAEETVSGIRIVKAFGRQARQTQTFEDKAGQVLDQSMKAIRIRSLLQPLFEFLPALCLALVLWVGGARVISGRISYGTFVQFALYVTQLVMPIRAIGWIASDIQMASTAAGRIFEVLDEEPGVADSPDAVALQTGDGEVSFEGVTCTSEEGQAIVQGLSLTVPAGRSVALVGPTGCGKSTLLRLILRFLEPTSGRVKVDGQDIAKVTLHSLRKTIGTVFEETFLFSDTIEANISFGKPSASREEVVLAASLGQAHEFISELPDGYETMVGEHGYSLSGGQRQRVAIARAILMGPRILLLDDATSNVDPSVEAKIRKGLEKVMTNRTTLLVARRPGTAALADAVVFMDQGRVVASGTHHELWNSSPAYRACLTGDATRAVGA